MSSIDRMLRTAWRLALLLVVLAALLPMVGGIIRGAVTVVTDGAAHALGPLVGSGLVGILFIVLLIGLGVRLVRSLEDPTVARRRRADHERLRRTVRRPAEDIPAYGSARRVPPDEDPTLPLGDA